MSVRWDAAVDRTRAVFPTTLPLQQPSAGGSVADRIVVHVQLFGALAAVSAERSLALELPPATTVGDVVRALRERLGDGFAASIIDEAGGKRRCCRLFVDGVPVENLQAVLHPTQEPTQIELILLIALEGG